MRASRQQVFIPVEDSSGDAAETAGSSAARRAVERLFTLLLPRLAEWAHGQLPRYARRRNDTWDLVQEACLGAISHLPDLEARNPAQVDYYLKQSIRNRIRDEIRRAGIGEIASAEGLEVADRRSSPFADALESEERKRFRAALLRLDDEDQLLVVGRIELKLTYQELARATGRESAEAARCAARRAMFRLAREFGVPEGHTVRVANVAG